MDDVLSVGTVVREYGVSYTAVYKWIAAGKVRVAKEEKHGSRTWRYVRRRDLIDAGLVQPGPTTEV